MISISTNVHGIPRLSVYHNRSRFSYKESSFCIARVQQGRRLAGKEEKKKGDRPCSIASILQNQLSLNILSEQGHCKYIGIGILQRQAGVCLILHVTILSKGGARRKALSHSRRTGSSTQGNHKGTEWYDEMDPSSASSCGESLGIHMDLLGTEP